MVTKLERWHLVLRGASDSERPASGGRGLLTCRSQLFKWEGFLECAVSACGTGNVPVLLAVTSLARSAAHAAQIMKMVGRIVLFD